MSQEIVLEKETEKETIKKEKRKENGMLKIQM